MLFYFIEICVLGLLFVVDCVMFISYLSFCIFAFICFVLVSLYFIICILNFFILFLEVCGNICICCFCILLVYSHIELVFYDDSFSYEKILIYYNLILYIYGLYNCTLQFITKLKCIDFDEHMSDLYKITEDLIEMICILSNFFVKFNSVSILLNLYCSLDYVMIRIIYISAGF